MLLFLAGVCINCIAVALIALNGIKDSLSANNNNTRNDIWHILALVLAGVVALAFYHKNNGNTGLARIIVWLPATPLLLSGVLLLLMTVLRKPTWK